MDGREEAGVENRGERYVEAAELANSKVELPRPNTGQDCGGSCGVLDSNEG
jgi:hypothetical protein